MNTYMSLQKLFLLVALLVSFNTHAQLFDQPKGFGSEALAEPEFLKVDEAFIFSSEQNQQGLRLHWQIADEYYLYKERFKFKSTSEGITIGEPQYSKPGKSKTDPYFGEVHVYHNDIEVFLPLSLAPNVSDAEVKISYQGCAEAGLCYPPKHQYALFVPSAGSAEEYAQSPPSQINSNTKQVISQQNFDDATGIFQFIQNSSLPVIAGIFFLLGLGLTFTPCVFPMIPIITSIIAGQSNPTASKSFLLALAYVLGMAITYAAAGVITGLLGASANIQAALQDPALLIAFSIIFVLLAFAMFGFYELQLPVFLRDRLNTTSQNLSGGHIVSVFFIGALSALIVSPCVSAPLAGSLLYISSTGDAVIGGLSLFALGLGMGVPLILIAVGGGKWLPKAGAWMDRVKAVFGVMLLAVAIWLLDRVIPAQVSMVLWALLVGISAVQMGAFEAANYGWQRFWKGLGLILALYAALMIIGLGSGNSDPLQPLSGLSARSADTSIDKPDRTFDFKLVYDLNELETQLNSSPQKPIMVDFYADWCISCKVMESQVFPMPEIASKLEQLHLVKADVTANDAGNQALLETYGLFGPPSILFFDHTGRELKELRIVGEITAEGFKKRLLRVLENS